MATPNVPGKVIEGHFFPQTYLDEYCGTSIVAAGACILILTTIFTVLRFYTRKYIQKTYLGWDDWLIIPAYFVTMAMIILSTVMIRAAGVGYHVVAVEPHKIPVLLKCLVAVSYVYLTAATIPKLSICALYLRIFVKPGIRWAIWATVAILIANWCAYVIAIPLECRPMAYIWDKTIPGGQCFDILAFYRSVNFPSLFTDFLLLIIPIPTVWSLNMPKVQKGGLTLIFVCGSVGTVAGIVRMAVFFRTNALIDPTWVASELNTWSIVEPGMYLIASCLPVLRPLFVLLTPAWIKNSVQKTLVKRGYVSSHTIDVTGGEKQTFDQPRTDPTMANSYSYVTAAELRTSESDTDSFKAELDARTQRTSHSSDDDIEARAEANPDMPTVTRTFWVSSTVNE